MMQPKEKIDSTEAAAVSYMHPASVVEGPGALVRAKGTITKALK